VPRVINLLCDRAMMGAYGRDQAVVSPNLVAEAAKETFGAQGTVGTASAAPWVSQATTRGVVLGLLIATVAVAAVLWVGQTERPGEDHAIRPPAIEPTDQQALVAERKPATTAEISVARVDPWILNVGEAELALWSLWSGQALVGRLCEQAPGAGMRCASSDMDTWNAVQANNRPAILDIRRPDGFAGRVLLVSMSDSVALLSTGKGVCQVPLASLAGYWRGGLSYLWSSPQGWVGPLSEGDQGSVVTQVVADLSRLDGLPPPPLDAFTPALTERVKQFQQSMGLEVDGVIGVRTLQALNDALGVSPTLVMTFERAQTMGEVSACL